jgi:23S rRNA pseudouridine1911/1915/1917 synthase
MDRGMRQENPRFQVLFEDNHLLVLNKPAGLATMGVAAGTASLFELAKAYIKQKYHKPGNVYLGVVSRLDAVVSGAIVLARTSKAAARLAEQFRQATVLKTYWAIVSPPPVGESETWEDWLLKDERQKRMLVVDRRLRGAQRARLSFETRRRLIRHAWLEITLETGRKHQIRAQCAFHDCPIVGDYKYGSTLPFPNGIALLALSLFLSHPTRDEVLAFDEQLPRAWQLLAVEIGWDLNDPS